jgi:hypothetical protein
VANTRLAGLRTIDIGNEFGPEHIAIGPDGTLYAAILGYPDNLMRGRDGRIWVGLFRPRNPAADGLAQRPFVRKVLLRLPRFLLPVGGHVFAFDEAGRVTEDWQDPSGAYPEDDRRDRDRGSHLHP